MHDSERNINDRNLGQLFVDYSRQSKMGTLKCATVHVAKIMLPLYHYRSEYYRLVAAGIKLHNNKAARCKDDWLYCMSIHLRQNTLSANARPICTQSLSTTVRLLLQVYVSGAFPPQSFLHARFTENV